MGEDILLITNETWLIRRTDEHSRCRPTVIYSYDRLEKLQSCFCVGIGVIRCRELPNDSPHPHLHLNHPTSLSTSIGLHSPLRLAEFAFAVVPPSKLSGLRQGQVIMLMLLCVVCVVKSSLDGNM